jgi:hypothetical protein
VELRRTGSRDGHRDCDGDIHFLIVDEDALSSTEFKGTLIRGLESFEDVPGLAFEDGELAGIHFFLKVVVFVEESVKDSGGFLPPLFGG